jgi:hypothetical protein
MIVSFSSLRKGDRKNGGCVPRLFKRVIAYKFAPMREDHPCEERQATNSLFAAMKARRLPS